MLVINNIRSHHFCIFLVILFVFGIIIISQQETKLRKKKHNKLFHLAKNKLDCIKMLISNSTEDGIISHDQVLEILKEKKECNGLKNEDKIENV